MADKPPVVYRRTTGGKLLPLVLGVVRLGIVVVVYPTAALAAGLAAFVTGWLSGTGSAAVAAFVAAVAMPVGLTLGFVVWLWPASLRAAAIGEDPEIAVLTPRRADGLLFVAVTAAVAAAPALFVAAGTPVMGAFLGLAGAMAAGLIAVTGGRQVAQLWVVMLQEVED